MERRMEKGESFGMLWVTHGYTRHNTIPKGPPWTGSSGSRVGISDDMDEEVVKVAPQHWRILFRGIHPQGDLKNAMSFDELVQTHVAIAILVVDLVGKFTTWCQCVMEIRNQLSYQHFLTPSNPITRNQAWKSG